MEIQTISATKKKKKTLGIDSKKNFAPLAKVTFVWL
jgi:hypothetical protein